MKACRISRRCSPRLFKPIASSSWAASPSSSRHSSTFTAKDAASYLLDTLGNTVTTRRQLIDANQLQKLALTLGRPVLPGGIDVSELAPPEGTPLPPGYHLVYFTSNGVEADLGKDGTDKSYNAPAPFTRRMWAGGRMRWPVGESATAREELRVGDEAEERTRLLSATPKASRSAGEMVLVEVEKEIWTPRGLAIVDRRSWVLRPELDATIAATQMPKLAGADVRAPSEVKDSTVGGAVKRHLRWSPTGLFRFSALTFNGHKIHYNEDWTLNVEGHPGLVVHGPLNLINMLDYWRDLQGHTSPGEIVYRATAPVYAGEEYQIYKTGEKEGGVWDVVAEKQGIVCMKGEISP